MTIINVGALAGVWVVPMMNTRLYKMVLMYLICLAVGCLCGNAILSLIPEVRSGGGGCGSPLTFVLWEEYGLSL